MNFWLLRLGTGIDVPLDGDIIFSIVAYELVDICEGLAAVMTDLCLRFGGQTSEVLYKFVPGCCPYEALRSASSKVLEALG